MYTHIYRERERGRDRGREGERERARERERERESERERERDSRDFPSCMQVQEEEQQRVSTTIYVRNLKASYTSSLRPHTLVP